MSHSNSRWGGRIKIIYYVMAIIGMLITSSIVAYKYFHPNEVPILPQPQSPPAVSAPARQAFEPEMVSVQGGTFKMGGDDNEACFDEKPIHTVTVGRFSIGKYEITQAQWYAVMGTRPSQFKNCDNCPVERVSWEDIQLFLHKLNSLSRKRYRLPTEAEWEYAARGGNRSNGSKYSGSNDLHAIAWYYDNSDYKTHPVGWRRGNELGIYDMSGNVWEWCSDWYSAYNSDAVHNPTGDTTGGFRVLRGGSWLFGANRCRVARRTADPPSRRDNNYGFRLVSFP